MAFIIAGREDICQHCPAQDFRRLERLKSV
jgi:hypothetical protein